MSVWDKKIPWSFMLLLAAVAGEIVKYPGPVCAVKGSTVTLPCTFKPLDTVSNIRWCANYKPCMYDSESTKPNPRYIYLGDMKSDCTLQIRNIQMIDNTTFNLEIYTASERGHGAARFRVADVTVIEPTEMRIISSSDTGEMNQNQHVTLSCTTTCTFHQLEVTWFKDGTKLPQSGPALYLGPLTAEDSGNYTCALETNKNTISPPYAVRVKEKDEGMKHETCDKLLIGRVFLFILLTLLVLIATAAIIIKRTCVCKKAAAEN